MSQNGTTNAASNVSVRRERFADGGQTRLALSDGDWVAVRKELTYGQQRRLAAAGLAGVPAALAEQGQGQQLTLDMAAYDLERLHTWLLDWSFKDEEGDHILLTRERIEALHPDTAKEINDALDAHIEALEAKKGPPVPAASAGPSAPAATSSSATASAGRGKS